MGLKIRLARAGAKKRPYYHIVVADSRSPRDGRFIEKLGSYNPMLPQEHADRIRLQNERMTHWISQGALPTERVAKFLGHARGWRRCRCIASSRSNPRRRRRRRSAPRLKRRPEHVSARPAHPAWGDRAAARGAGAGACAQLYRRPRGAACLWPVHG